MLTLRLSFPWGRYYAHPWGQNPARITEAEWPPSPWRLLRAIAAAWFQANPGSDASPELIQTLGILGRELPTFTLPKVSFSRSVHYQPNYGTTPKSDVALARYKRVRHENHFVAVGGDVLIQWQLANVSDETATTIRNVLNSVMNRVSYFGRAESICELRVEYEQCDNADLAHVAMQDQKPCRRIGADFREAFCPDPETFQPTDLWQRRNACAEATVAPVHLVQDLLDTPQPVPDGAAWYSYQMPSGWPQRWITRQPQQVKRPRDRSRIIAHFLEFSLHCRIPVPVKHTVSLATAFRAAAIKNFKRRDANRRSFALSGHDRPEEIEGNHLHAFYLPIPDRGGNSLQQFRVWCQHGFTQEEINAMLSVGSLYWAHGRYPVRPVLLNMSRELPSIECSSCWQSLTPFVPPRYWHRNRNGRIRESLIPERQICHCLKEDHGPTGCTVSRLIEGAADDWDICKVHLPPATSVISAEPESRIGVRLELDFGNPVALPLPAFGHSCHFGLGIFVPRNSKDAPLF
jgi:CRISPR-associated protein Csb2